MFKIEKLFLIVLMVPIILFSNPRITQAEAFLKAKDYKGALKRYSQVLETEPQNLKALYGKAKALSKMKDYSQALETYTLIEKIDPKYKDTLYRKAKLLRSKKNYKEAVEYYKKYQKIKPNDPDTYYGIGQTYLKNGENVNSAYYFYLYTKNEKRDSEKKWVLKAEKKVDSLKKDFTPDQLKKYELLVKGENKEIVKTKVKTEKKVEVKKNSVITPIKKDSNSKTTVKDKTLNYPFKKGENIDNLYIKGKYKEAIKGYKTYLKDPIKRREGLFKIAISYSMLEEYNKTVDYLSQIFIEETDNNSAKELLKILLSNPIVVEKLINKKNDVKKTIAISKARYFISQGLYYDAIDILDILIKKVEQNSVAFLLKIDILRILGQYDKIASSITEYLTKYPNDIFVIERYGDYLSGQKKAQEAKDQYNKVLTLTKDKFIITRIKEKIGN